MPMLVIEGTYRILNASPDGDSIRFYPTNPADWDEIEGSHKVEPNSTGGAQLRMDGIDALETHYAPGTDGLGVLKQPARRPGWIALGDRCRYAREHGYSIVAEFVDDGVSGTANRSRLPSGTGFDGPRIDADIPGTTGCALVDVFKDEESEAREFAHLISDAIEAAINAFANSAFTCDSNGDGTTTEAEVRACAFDVDGNGALENSDWATVYGSLLFQLGPNEVNVSSALLQAPLAFTSAVSVRVPYRPFLSDELSHAVALNANDLVTLLGSGAAVSCATDVSIPGYECVYIVPGLGPRFSGDAVGPRGLPNPSSDPRLALNPTEPEYEALVDLFNGLNLLVRDQATLPFPAKPVGALLWTSSSQRISVGLGPPTTSVKRGQMLAEEPSVSVGRLGGWIRFGVNDRPSAGPDLLHYSFGFEEYRVVIAWQN